jgi:acyl carrier protein
MVTQRIQTKVEEVVLNLLPALNREDLSPNQDIFNLGLDSINAMTLVLDLQRAFGVTFDPAEIQFENFRTTANMVKLIQTKTAGQLC